LQPVRKQRLVFAFLGRSLAVRCRDECEVDGVRERRARPADFARCTLPFLGHETTAHFKLNLPRIGRWEDAACPPRLGRKASEASDWKSNVGQWVSFEFRTGGTQPPMQQSCRGHHETAEEKQVFCFYNIRNCLNTIPKVTIVIPPS
jgi:hypothetical protein